MSDSINNLDLHLLGPYAFAKDVLKERLEVTKLYNFYYGKTKVGHNELMTEYNQGQSWFTNPELDYTPSKDIRNHVKRLIKRQGRFMFGISPDIFIKSYSSNVDDNTSLEELRKFLDNKIFEANEFWKDTYKAFIDCTIGKRILLRVEANEDSPIGIHYHTMDEFTFEVDSSDYKKLSKVIIAYLEASTANKSVNEQVWKRWKYYIENGTCMLEYGTYDGKCAPIGEVKTIDTKFKEIPCRVIINDGLTGDITGSSDLEDLIDMQNGYNKTNSDYRDALRFRMFEQPVFIDADEGSTEDIVIAPNAIIDLKSDTTGEGNTRADAKMLSSSFNFSTAADSFITTLKNDMYEIMDQPKPDDVRVAQSGKALKMTFWDLKARCDEKWVEWESALKWLIKYVIDAIIQLNLYKEHWDSKWNNIDYKIVIKHNYPIPEDEAEKKKIALQEVSSNVRSIKSYIKEISDEEDCDGEYNQILKEIKDLKDVERDDFIESVRKEFLEDSNSSDVEDEDNNNQDDNTKEDE